MQSQIILSVSERFRLRTSWTRLRLPMRATSRRNVAPGKRQNRRGRVLDLLLAFREHGYSASGKTRCVIAAVLDDYK